MVWQASVAKVAAFLSCAVAGIVAFVSLAITKDPKGPDAGEIEGASPAAVWIVRFASGMLLLVIAGLFYEREALGEKLPKIPQEGMKRNVPFIIPVLLLIVIPVVHLVFALSVIALGVWFILTRLQTTVARLRAVALYDGLILIGLSLVLLRAGPSDQYRVSQVIVSLYAFAGGLLPGLAIACTFGYSPGLTRFTRLCFVLAAMHAVAVVLQAIGDFVYQVIDGLEPVYTRDQCFPALDSLLGVIMESTAGALVASSASKIGSGPLPGCPAEAWSGIPCDPIKWYVVLVAALAGSWLALVVATGTFWEQPVRVAPGDDALAQRRRVRRRSCAKGAVAVALFLYLAGVVIPFHWVFWLCPDEGYGRPVLEAPETTRWFNSTTSTTITDTSTTTTTTTTTITTTTTDTTTSQTTTSTTTKTTTSTTLVSSTSTTSTPDVWEIGTTVPTENETTTPNATNATFIAGPTCDERLPLVVDPFAPAPSRLGCRCVEPEQVRFWAWTQIPTEQIASTWCDLGNIGPVLVFLFVYCIHGYTWSLAGEVLAKYEIKEREVTFKKHQEKIRKKAMSQGMTMDAATKAAQAESTIVLWKVSPHEELPKHVAELRKERMFNV